MKRLISLVLAFVIFFGIGGTIAYNINNINRQNEATSFTEQLNAVVKKYESRQETQNRLIVNSNKIKETYGAVAVIRSQNFQIMQFDSYSKAENAKLNIEKLGIDCDRDDYAYVESNGNDTSKDLWAAKNVQCDVTNYYLNSTGEKYRDITVAVMDTGINPKHEAQMQTALKMTAGMVLMFRVLLRLTLWIILKSSLIKLLIKTERVQIRKLLPRLIIF